MRTRAFSLIEIVMALALVGLVLLGLNTFIFSMSELWGKNSDVRLFDQHVRAVTRYLQHEMERASLPPTAVANATPVGVQPVTPSGGSQDNLITYMQLSGGRILKWPEVPLPEVYCSLEVKRDKGLYMLWHSDLENNFNTDPPRETLVSPFVTALEFDYYDTTSSQWSTETMLKTDTSNNPIPPQRLEFTFTYSGLVRKMFVIVPTPGQGLPNPW